MWGLYDFLSRALLPHHRRYVVLCSKTTPSRESRQFDAHPCDGAYPVAKKFTACQRCYRASPKEQKVAPRSITQNPRSDLNYRRSSLLKETFPFFRGNRFDGNGWSRFVDSR